MTLDGKTPDPGISKPERDYLRVATGRQDIHEPKCSCHGQDNEQTTPRSQARTGGG